MRFSIDAHAIGRHLTGNEVYVRSLLEGFASLDKKSEFIAYTSVRGAEEHVPSRIRTRRVSENPFIRLGIDLARRVHADAPDLLHVQYTAPLFCPAPVVVSIHDVSYLEHPEFFPASRRVQLRLSVERTVRRAAKILTLSEFSRQGIARSYNLDPERIAVVPAACSNVFKPVSRPKAKSFVEGRFQIKHPFILCVGDLQPRKNPLGLIRAFEELIGNCPELPHHLVMVGKDTWYASKVHQAAEHSPFGNRIHFTGYVDDTELLQIYNACDIFVFPSFYEGFGIPILEAMACGRAVACANTSAMPEVAGTAAILFNPHSTEEMMVSMRNLLRNAELRSRKERLGQQNAARFSWEGTAKQTLDVYYQVAGTRTRKAQRAAPVGRR
ncbi:MAG: glycosyltransferase family 4 protein [Bryobacterales bacterium]|nr:glycosyltransferase family 4 protein [Bryobacterales bacterium]